MGMIKDITKFHKKFDLQYQGPARMLNPELFHFRKRFMEEELREWSESMDRVHEELMKPNPREEVIQDELENQLDALVDLVYVALGTAHLQGFSGIFLKAWKRVQKANMKKVRAERADQSKRGSTYDVVKPEGWKAPTLRDLIARTTRK